MYIEFIGASGAGKTTIVGKAATALTIEDIVCVTRKTFFAPDQKRNYKLSWTIFHMWRLDMRTFGCLWRWARTRNFTNAVLKAHEYIKLRHILSNTQIKTVALWDSGFVQFFSKMTVAGFLSKELACTLIQKRLPDVCLLVFLDTSIEEALERKRERARGWGSVATIERLEENIADEKKMKNTYGIQDMQKNILKELEIGGVNVVTLDGMLSPEENAGKLVQIIKKQIHV